MCYFYVDLFCCFVIWDYKARVKSAEWSGMVGLESQQENR